MVAISLFSRDFSAWRKFRPRWLRVERFRMQHLFVFVALLGLLGVVPAWRMRLARQQDAAASRLREICEVRASRLRVSDKPWIDRALEQVPWLQRGDRRGLFEHYWYVNLTGADDEACGLVGRLPWLRECRVEGAHLLTDAGLAQLETAPGLVTLVADNTNITDTGLPLLRVHAKLATLALSYTAITDEGLQTLADLPSLKTLTAFDTFVTAAGVERLLQRRPDLRIQWSHTPNEVHWQTLRDLAVQGVAISSSVAGATVPPALAPYQELADRNAYAITITKQWHGGDDTLARLPDIVHLKSAMLNVLKLSPAGLRHLARCRELESLDLSLCEIDPAATDSLQALDQLRQVRLDGTELNDRGVEFLASLSRLTLLSLMGTKATGATLDTLAPLSQLEELWLPTLPLTDADLERLPAKATLKRLYLSDTQITDAGLAHLAALPRLEYLNLGLLPITAQGMAQLQKVPNLRTVVLHGHKQEFATPGKLQAWLNQQIRDGVRPRPPRRVLIRRLPNALPPGSQPPGSGPPTP